MNIAIIPARGGSKRIPHKNIKDFCGKPIIGWSIEAADRSGCFEHVIVSTDDLETAEIARRLGAEVPFMRPAEISDDHVPIRKVIAHGAAEAERVWGPLDYVCCLYATAPLLESDDLVRGLGLLSTSSMDFCLAVTDYSYPIQRALKMERDGSVSMFWPEHRLARSQDLEKAYHDAGQFCWYRRDALLTDKPVCAERTVPLVLPRSRVQDIDTMDDWHQAEQIFRATRSYSDRSET